ncbi:hypothetical protein HWV62_42132 [Athelia sp. TMB]|nr:hypothetical protein HWV62_42132 [Athelia sp. TMB]
MPLPSDVDLKWLASERFKNTQLHGYDQVCGFCGYQLSESAHPPQITTVSQEAINRQIQLAHTDSASDSPLRQFSTSVSENDDWTQIVNAKLDPSTVELLLGTDEKQHKTATIKDWRVVSKVRLNLLELDPEKVPKFVRDALTNPNDYSIRQLLVNFTTADISTYDPTLSVIDDDEAREDFHKHVKMYWDGLKKNDNGSHSTIHYLPTLKKPDTYLAPTIVPTSLNFQNFPFVLTGWNKGGEKNNDYNMLIYLQMTEKRDFPPDLLPAPKANWVVPATPRYDGTVCLSKRTFLDSWLLPRLAQFNKTTTWYSVIEDDSSKTPAPYNLDKGHFGPSGYENATDTPWTADTAGSNDTVLKYTYSRNEVMTTKGNQTIKFAQQKVNVWNHLEIPVGLDANNESVIKTIDVLTWSAELVLKTEAHGAENGKLKIEVRNVKGDASIGEQGYSHASADVKRQLEGVLEALRAKIRKEGDALVNTMTHLKGDVDKLFGSSWSFIFGGNDDFWIDGAGFNGRVPSMIIMGCGLTSSMIYSEGDLLAQLIYRIKD